MEVIVFFNGLGNQMSQYAFYLQKKSVNKSTYFISICNKHYGLELNKIFKINCKETIFQKGLFILYRILRIEKVKIISVSLKVILGLFNCKIIDENFNYDFNKEFLAISKGITFYYGGWHSEKYFLSVKDKILHDFEFVKIDDPENTCLICSIMEQNSVSIHVRLGDYLSEDNIKLYGDICNDAYYETAMNIIEDKVSSPHFFVFSNDIEWVKSNLHIKNVTYVNCNTGRGSWKDMYLMSLCKHNIVANSSFSWWGAWLNKNPDKIVISPSKFLKSDVHSDVYPESWIKLSDYK